MPYENAIRDVVLRLSDFGGCPRNMERKYQKSGQIVESGLLKRKQKQIFHPKSFVRYVENAESELSLPHMARLPKKGPKRRNVHFSSHRNPLQATKSGGEKEAN